MAVLATATTVVSATIQPASRGLGALGCPSQQGTIEATPTGETEGRSSVRRIGVAKSFTRGATPAGGSDEERITGDSP